MATTTNFGLNLFDEGTKIDNATMNTNFNTIDQYLGGASMYEKLVGTLTNIDHYKAGSSSATISYTYPTTNFDFMKIRMYAGTAAERTASGIGYGTLAYSGEVNLLKPTANTNYYIPVYYGNTGKWSRKLWQFTTTGFSFSQNNSDYGIEYVVEFYKYSAT